ncbi:MAG: hypothetical protein JNL73_19650 [Anaerolineales bacterium]|nr:hypothetical protein [Anaerolineales bacterium]
MGGLSRILERELRIWIAGHFVVHVILAAFAPCPYRIDLADWSARSGFALIGHDHSDHATTSDQPQDVGHCSFDLLRAMYGLFEAAPIGPQRASLSAALFVRVNVEPVLGRLFLPIQIDRPPRIA